jgi:hypothetical protein
MKRCPGTVEVWTTLALLNADFLALASRRVGWAWWPWLNRAAAPMGRSGGAKPDLIALDLERMPQTEHELRRAYRAAFLRRVAPSHPWASREPRKRVGSGEVQRR